MVAGDLITAAELFQLVGTEKISLLDARENDEYAIGHIPGAVNLHPSRLERVERLENGGEVTHQFRPSDEVAPLLAAAGVRDDRPVCIYDEGGGYLAARLWWMLDHSGHPRPCLLDGGMFIWAAEGGAVTMESGAAQSGDFVPRPVEGRRVDFSLVITLMGRSDTVLLNSLSSEGFAAGAIPGSVNLPYTETFAEDNFPLLKSRHEIDALFADRGISRRHLVVCYCEIGYSACQLYFAARYAGYPRVALYDGSMVDWEARGGELQCGA